MTASRTATGGGPATGLAGATGGAATEAAVSQSRAGRACEIAASSTRSRLTSTAPATFAGPSGRLLTGPSGPLLGGPSGWRLPAAG